MSDYSNKMRNEINSSEFAETAMSVSSKKGFKALIRKLWEKEWVVYSKAPFGGAEAVLVGILEFWNSGDTILN